MSLDPGTAISLASELSPQRIAAMKARAQELEGVFLSEMLGNAGFGAMDGGFGGGIGEAQFASFLRQEHASALAQSGGIGLQEALFNAMLKAESHEG